MRGLRSKRAAFCSVFLLSLLLCVASVSANFIPPPAGTRYGVIYINADGSLSPADLPVAKSGNTYTLQGNLTNFGFKIECDGVTLDGAGFALVTTDWYSPRTGVVLEGCSRVTVKNLLIVNFDTGILVNASSHSYVADNRVVNSINGIYVTDGSSNNTFIGNSLQGSSFDGYGVYISDSPSNIFRNNSVSNGERTFFWASTNKFNFGVKVSQNTPLSNLVQDIDTSNLLDGKPMVYWVGQQDKVTPADAGYVALVNCRNITVQNLQLQNNGQGVLLAGTTGSIVRGCNLTGNNVGLTLLQATNNTVNDNDVVKNVYGATAYSSDNTFTYNRFKDNEREHVNFQDGYQNSIDISNTVNGAPLYYAVNQHDKVVPAEVGYVFLFNCTRMIIQNLTIKNQMRGLCLVSTSDSLVINNELENNQNGVCLSNSANNKIVKNRFSGNSQSSIHLKFSDNNTVAENQIVNGHVGLNVENCTGNIISRNTITCNYTGVEFSGSSNNKLLENSIEGNGRAGITLSYLSNNNLIAGNNVADNKFVTVDLNNAQNNTFTCNNFKIAIEVRNGVYRTHQILDIHANALVTSSFVTPSHNIWDKDNQGNYWSDYKGNDANGDSVGDTPHIVDTSPHAEPIIVNGKNYTIEATPDVDRYPLTTPYSFPLEPQLKVLEPTNSNYSSDSIPLTFTLTDTALKVKYSLDQQEEMEANTNTTLNTVTEGPHTLLMWTVSHNWGTPANFQIVNFNSNREKPQLPTQTIKPTENEPNTQTQNNNILMLGAACLAATAAAIIGISLFKRTKTKHTPHQKTKKANNLHTRNF